MTVEVTVKRSYQQKTEEYTPSNHCNLPSSRSRLGQGFSRAHRAPAHHGELREVQDGHMDIRLWRLGLLSDSVQIGGAVAGRERIPRVAAM